MVTKEIVDIRKEFDSKRIGWFTNMAATWPLFYCFRTPILPRDVMQISSLQIRVFLVDVVGSGGGGRRTGDRGEGREKFHPQYLYSYSDIFVS